MKNTWILPFILYFFFPLPLEAQAMQKMAVIVTHSPTLTPQEKVVLENFISKGFEASNKYVIADEKTLDAMLEDKVQEALHLGLEKKLDEIQKKYSVDVLVDLSSKIQSQVGIGGYSMASASVTISCRSNNDASLFGQKVSEPQNGYAGMPEWLGITSGAARKVALQAAVASILLEFDIDTIDYPSPMPVKVKFKQLNSNKSIQAYLVKYPLDKGTHKKIVRLIDASIGNREKLTASLLDADKRLAAIGITGIDIDLQRNRRMDTARFEIYDVRKRRLLRKIDLPRSINGIRRPRSRDIVDIAFSPGGRFSVIASRHPVLWLWDNFTGQCIDTIVLPSSPEQVQIDKKGTVVQVQTSSGPSYFSINKD